MSVRGLTDARQATAQVVSDVDRRAQRAVTAALIVGQGYATLMTPVDTSHLINSQYRTVHRRIGGYTGLVGYTATYAAAVHEASGRLRGQPRAHFGTTRDGVQFGGGTGRGNYWDPTGQPQFLRRGFEDHRQEIDNVMREIMIE